VPFEATLGSSFVAVVSGVPFGATLGSLFETTLGVPFVGTVSGVPFGATLGLLFGVVFSGVPFGATLGLLFGGPLGFKLPGVTPPPGIVGVPGASGGVTPGGDELEGAAFEGDRLVDGATAEGDDDGEDGADDAEPGGAAAAGAALAAAKPSATTTAKVCNLSMLLPLMEVAQGVRKTGAPYRSR
jgi:hypothetical protein